MYKFFNRRNHVIIYKHFRYKKLNFIYLLFVALVKVPAAVADDDGAIDDDVYDGLAIDSNNQQ